jgi:hypothetical protein
MFGFNLWDFLVYSIPWWLQIILLAVPVAALLWFAVGIFGWNRVKGWIIPALALIGAAGALSRAQQKGYKDRDKKIEVVEDKARDEFKKIHDRNEALPENELDAKNDPFIKP